MICIVLAHTEHPVYCKGGVLAVHGHGRNGHGFEYMGHGRLLNAGDGWAVEAGPVRGRAGSSHVHGRACGFPVRNARCETSVIRHGTACIIPESRGLGRSAPSGLVCAFSPLVAWGAGAGISRGRHMPVFGMAGLSCRRLCHAGHCPGRVPGAAAPLAWPPSGATYPAAPAAAPAARVACRAVAL